MRESIQQCLVRELLDSRLAPVKLVLALAELSWAVFIFWPGDAFVSTPAYASVFSVMDETLWGLIFCFVGIFQFMTIISEPMKRKYSTVASCWSATLWTYLNISVLFSVYPPPAAAASEFTFMVVSVWILIRPMILSSIFRASMKDAKQQIEQENAL